MEQCSCLSLAFETAYSGLAAFNIATEHVRFDQFDGSWSSEHEMFAQPNFTHTAGAEFLVQLIAADLPGLMQMTTQALDENTIEPSQKGTQVGRE